MFEAKKIESVVYVNTRPPYPEEVAGKPYATNYTPPIFLKYNGITRNAIEYIRQHVNVLTPYSHNHKLKLREFSKFLEG